MGAIATGGVRVLNDEVVRALNARRPAPARHPRRPARPLLPQDFRRARAPRAGASESRSDPGRGTRVRAGGRPHHGGTRARARHDHDVAGQAAGARLRRRAPQRVRPDGRGALFCASPPERSGLHAARVGGGRRQLDPARYNLRTFDRRLAAGDPWADFWEKRQRLPEIGR
jgi:hypothetical protein